MTDKITLINGRCDVGFVKMDSEGVDRCYVGEAKPAVFLSFIDIDSSPEVDVVSMLATWHSLGDVETL